MKIIQNLDSRGVITLKNILFFFIGFAFGKISENKENNTLYNVIKYYFDTNICDENDLYFYVKDGCISKAQYMFITKEKYPELPQA